MLYHHNRGPNASFFCILLLFIDKGESQIICPNVAELGYPALLTCFVSSGSNNRYLTPTSQTAATCFSNITSCISRSGQFDRFSGTVINTTHSYLWINETRMSDEGEWNCWDTSKKTESKCTLVLNKTPTCNITSDRNTDDIYVEDEITLFVDIGDYYCSLPAGFNLRTGQKTMKLLKKKSVFSSTFKLTDFHCGPVNLLFTCNQITKPVQCGNIQRLVKHKFKCYIASDKITEKLETDEEISLTVDIEDYCCSGPGSFMLETGNTTEELKEINRVHKGIQFGSHFSVTEKHFGPVKVIYLCNTITRRFSCDGVKLLQKYSHPAQPSGQVSLSLVLLSASGYVVLVVVGTAVCIYVVIRKKKRWNKRYAAYLNPLGNGQSQVSGGHALGTSGREENESVMGSHEYVSINNDVSLDSGSDVRNVHNHFHFHFDTISNQERTRDRCTTL